MKNVTIVIMLITMLAGATSCKKDVVGEGPVRTETRSLSGFTAIDFQINGNVYYTREPNWKVEVTAKESIHSLLETVIINNSLVVRYRNGRRYDEDGSIRINVSGPAVSGFLLNSSGSIYAMNDINVPNLFLKATGSGDINLANVNTDHIDALTTVSGRITIAGGTTISGKLRTDGSARIDMSGVSARAITAKTVGSGDIRVKVSDHLDATIDGSGDIYFRGYPFISSHLHGSGDLIRF